MMKLNKSLSLLLAAAVMGAPLTAMGAETSREDRIKNIESIGMEPMTMPFKVDRQARLERFKPGDRIRFTVVSKDDHLVADRMEPQP